MPATHQKQIKFDARKLMEQAIEASCRGELRSGDHAEYTLLERKNCDTQLDGSVLFVTLEPCAPNARNTPKMSCAERIVLARIKEVWVGIEDPDPTVDRKGIKYLQDAGIAVHMFDREPQEIIQVENKDFLAQALERAEAFMEETAKEVTLSTLEKAVDVTVTDDLSDAALKEYRLVARIEAKVGSDDFNRRLLQQGLLKKEDKQLSPTGFGLLLFGKEPRTVIPQAAMLATIYYPDGTEETKDFDGPMVLIPKHMEKWLNDKLPNVIDRGAMQRKDVPPLPFEMIREAVVNALIHRDYDIQEAKCQLVITVDTVTVKSPGGPLPPITLKQLQDFNAPMLSRNPVLHYVFAQMEMAEERGLGLRSLKKRADELGLPRPKYSFDDPYLALILYRNLQGVENELPEAVAGKLNADEKVAWQFLNTKESVTNRELMAELEFDERKAQRVLKKLIDLNLLRKLGKGPATSYEVVQS